MLKPSNTTNAGDNVVYEYILLWFVTAQTNTLHCTRMLYGNKTMEDFARQKQMIDFIKFVPQ